MCSLLITDEVHFHVNSFVNIHNFRHWGVENQIIFYKNELHPQRVTVRCEIMRDRIIGRTSLKTQKGLHRQSMERCRHIFITFLKPVVIHLRNRHELWFQQDCATHHIAN